MRACQFGAPLRTAENDDVQTEPVARIIATERDRYSQGVEEVPAQQCRSSVDPRAAPKQTRKDDGEDGSPDGDKVLPLKQSDIDQTPVIALPQDEKREAEKFNPEEQMSKRIRVTEMPKAEPETTSAETMETGNIDSVKVE